MAWWEMSESIHFDFILYDMFEWWGDYDDAFCRWTDDQWKSAFAEKLALKNYADDVNDFVWEEFGRFQQFRREEMAERKAQEKEERRKQEEQEKRDKEFQEEMKKESERPKTPFEVILNEVFNYPGIFLAVYKWTKEEWHERFEEKIRCKLDQGIISQETAGQIRMDLKEYIEMVYRGKAEMEAEYEESAKEREEAARRKEEEESRKQEQWERKRMETRAREQRKAKQLPEVRELIGQYQWAKTALKREASDDNYIKVFDICYAIIRNWGLLGCLDEFDGVAKYYENCVMDYHNMMGTAGSLYHVVFYYTDRNLVWEMGDLPERKAHIKKGLPYARLLYEILENEDSAEKYIDCYLQMSEFCRTGEDLEQLSYTDKAYKLAKEFALKFRTKKMVEKLKAAKAGLAWYYHKHQQEAEVKRVEEEFQKIKTELPENFGEEN